MTATSQPYGTAPAVRPGTLGLPSATASRGVALIVAMLTAGIFAGQTLHHALPVGGRWEDRVRSCLGAEPLGPDLTRARAAQDCAEGVNRILVIFEIGGIVVAIAGCLGLAIVAQRRVVRARRLRSGNEALVQRVWGLSAEAGLGRPPFVFVGDASQRDAFSFGLPGQYAMALPPGLAVRSRIAALFDPVVRHELAHIRHRDVMLGWSARAAGWLLVPLTAVPVVAMIASDQLDVLPRTLWRFAVLVTTVLFGAASIFRAREFEADLGSLRSPEQRAALVWLLERPARSDGRRSHPLRLHPSRDERVKVVLEPSRATRLGFADGFGIALLASLAMTSVTALLSDERALARWVLVGGPITVGVLFGVTMGLGLVRDALARRVEGRGGTELGPLLAGVLAGYALGQTASLAQVGSSSLTGFSPWWLALGAPIAALAATMITAAAADLLVDATFRLSRAGAVAVCLTLPAIVFASAMWVVQTITSYADLGGWSLTREALVTVLGTRVYAWTTVVIVTLVLALVVVGRGQRLYPHPVRTPRLAAILGVAAAAGAGAGATIVTFRATHGASLDAAESVQRFDAYTWVFALAGAAAVAALAVRYGRSGLAAGLAAGPIATALAECIFLGNNTRLGAPLTGAFSLLVLRSGFGLGAVVTLSVAVLYAAADVLSSSRAQPRRAVRRRSGALSAVVLALALSVVLAVTAIGIRETLSPLGTATVAARGLPSSGG